MPARLPAIDQATRRTISVENTEPSHISATLKGLFAQRDEVIDSHRTCKDEANEQPRIHEKPDEAVDISKRPVVCFPQHAQQEELIVTSVEHNRFGVFFEERRQKRKLTLREFCKLASCDPANISRMERGLMPPPKSREILERYACILGLEEATDDWYQFFDLAAADQGIVPADIMQDADLVKALPVFFRTLRGQKPTEKELRRIADKIRKVGK